ncbi:MAG: saccharopine dehydrogenase [Proteobacteria bacterium]|nr:saccharopine dehydrogenase [Pseudomonadota bacterium]
MAYAIYGAYGYTGELAARVAIEQGSKPLLLGRDPVRLAAVAERLGLEHRAVSLEDPELVEILRPLDVVLHCAGPFHRTWEAMAEACMKAGTHYLDVTGEISVFEGAARQSARAKEAGIALIPGVGYDVVPSDSLAKHLSERLPGTTHLNLALLMFGELSHGTATTTVENLGGGGAIRENGRIQKVGIAHDVRHIDFGRGPVKCVTIPWGDVSTAFYTTGIPNIRVYASLPGAAILGMQLLGGAATAVLGAPSVQKVLLNHVDKNLRGPDDAARARGKSIIWGEVIKGDERAEAILHGPEGYTLTVHAALEAVRRCEAGDVTPGFQTPAGMWGHEMVRGLEGVTITDR